MPSLLAFRRGNPRLMRGTPVVARATGGWSTGDPPCLSRWGTAVYNRYHALRALPTGFLFLEPRLPWDERSRDGRKLWSVTTHLLMIVSRPRSDIPFSRLWLSTAL
jgi:hypothetical protein